MMASKLWVYTVPQSPPIITFLYECEAVQGKLKGGFQRLILDLISRAQGGRMLLDDTVMGKCYRYCRCAGVGGGWQSTHLPPFLNEVERLYRTKQHLRA